MLNTGMAGSSDKYDILQACRRVLLKDLTVIVRHAGIYDREALEAMQEACGKHFDELASATYKGNFETEADGLTASRISLMPESALELDIQLGDMSRRLLEKQGDALRKAYLRFVTLLDRPDMATEDNPVGISTIIEGMRALFLALGRSTDEAIALLDPLEDNFTNMLPETYARINEVLESHNVAPAVARIQSSQAKGSMGAATTHGSAGAPNFGATGMFSAQTLGATGSLQAMMLARQPQGADSIPTAGGAVAAGPGSVISPEMLNRIVERIAALESQGQLSFAGSVMESGKSSADASASRLPSANDLGLQGVEAATIDTLGMIFSEILDHPELPDALKTALAGLQITMLKVAMLDPAFFSTPAHPARRLLDTIANLATTLPLDVDAHHPLMTAAASAAQQVRTANSSDPALFEAETARLEALLAERTQATIAMAAPYLEFAAKLQRMMAADAKVANTVAELLKENTPPELASLIRGEWARVLQSIAREEGWDGPAWAEQLEVIRKLRWSISPMQTPEERKQLAGQVPAIIRGLNAGFNRIQLPQADRDRILDLCFAMQTAALRGGATPAAPTTGTASTTTVDFDFSELAGPETGLTLPAFETLTLEDGRQLKVWRGERKESDAASVPLEMLSRIGDWLELKLPDATLVRGLWTQTDSDSGQILIQNPDWNYALLLAPEVLKYQLRSKQARVLRARSLFEEAAGKALQHAKS